jgi:hypothetical protein
MSEWLNVLVLKTNVAQVTVGSNPTLSEKNFPTGYPGAVTVSMGSSQKVSCRKGPCFLIC